MSRSARSLDVRLNELRATTPPGMSSPVQVGAVLEGACDDMDAVIRALTELRAEVAVWMKADDWPDELNDVFMHLELGLAGTELTRYMLGQARTDLLQINA